MKVREDRGWFRVAAEGGLIVASILLALALDAWWDGVQQEHRRDELIAELLLDFETTRTLMAGGISESDSLLVLMDGYFAEALSHEQTPVDSLKSLINAAFVPFDFQPALSSYRGASVSGDLRLVRNRELIEAFAEFDLAMGGFEERNRVWLEWYYMGDVAALRQELGSIRVVARRGTANRNDIPREFLLSDAAYRQLVHSRRMYSLVEASYNFRSALVSRLRQADEAAARVSEELGKAGI